MKYAIFLLFFSLPFAYTAQIGDANQEDQHHKLDNSKHVEDSIFQHDVLGVQIVSTKFYAEERAWIDKEYTPIHNALRTVSGVYSIELIDNDRVLFVVHSEKVTFDELKQYIIPYKQDFAVLRSLPYPE